MTISVLFVYKVDNMWKVNLVFISKVIQGCMFFVISTFLIISVFINWWTFLRQKHTVIVLNLLTEVDVDLKKMGVSVEL